VESPLADRLARYHELVAAIHRRTNDGVHRETPAVDFGLEGVKRMEFSGGSILTRDTLHPAGESFGVYTADWDAETPMPKTAPSFIAAAAGTRPKNWAFLDCETTGLSGGTGTLAFLVAIGRPLKTGFFIQQFFLSEPADEQGLLEAIELALDGVEVLWTYNGKCFDLPVLETRFRFWRRAVDLDRFSHVDLLVPTRILFRRRIGDCSLGNLEERILKVARIEDLPGAEVPSVYFEYLQTGRSPRLHRVFEHNRVDVLSLAVYAAYLQRVFEAKRPERLNYPEDVLSLALYFYRKKELEQAAACLDDARTFALGPELKAEYNRLRAYLHKRRGEYELACTHFQNLACSSPPDKVTALEELAKHHEHRRRDYRRALQFAEQAIALAERKMYFSGNEQTVHDLPALHHRRARLQRKLQALSHGPTR